MEHIIGFIILGLIVVSLVVFVILREISWKKKIPENEHNNVKYRYIEGAVEWQHLDSVIDHVRSKFPELKDFWIYIYPFEKPISTGVWPTGFARGPNPAPVPKTVEAAKQVQIINGTIEFLKRYPIFSPKPVIHIRQMKVAKDAIDVRLMRNGGELKGISGSAFSHEIAEHLLPWSRGEGPNGSHTRKDLKELTKELENEIKEKFENPIVT